MLYRFIYTILLQLYAISPYNPTLYVDDVNTDPSSWREKPVATQGEKDIKVYF